MVKHAAEKAVEEYHKWEKQNPKYCSTPPTYEWIKAMLNLEKAIKSKTKWDKLKNIKDSEINKTDIPELGKEFFDKAKIRLPKQDGFTAIEFFICSIIILILLSLAVGFFSKKPTSVHPKYSYDDRTKFCFVESRTEGGTILSKVECTDEVLKLIEK